MSSNLPSVTAAKARFPQPWKVLEGACSVSPETLRRWRIGDVSWPADKRIVATDEGFNVDWAAYDREFGDKHSAPETPVEPPKAPETPPQAPQAPPAPVAAPAPPDAPTPPPASPAQPPAEPPQPPKEVRDAQNWFDEMFE